MIPESEEVRREHRRRTGLATEEVIEDLERRDEEIERLIHSALKWGERAAVAVLVVGSIIGLLVGLATWFVLHYFLLQHNLAH